MQAGELTALAPSRPCADLTGSFTSVVAFSTSSGPATIMPSIAKMELIWYSTWWKRQTIARAPVLIS